MNPTNTTFRPEWSEGQGGTSDNEASGGSSPLRSPLFWRISAVVFISIVIIEAILLVFSWFSERDRLLNRIDDSFELLAPILAVSDDFGELGRLVQPEGNVTDHALLGYVLKTGAGIDLRGGDSRGLERISDLEDGRRFDAENALYESSLTFFLARESTDATLWYRVDATPVVEQLQDYVVRILGLVVLISLFVTVGCLLGLTPLLIRPLRRLEHLMRIGQQRGLQQIASQAGASTRQDEIGQVYRSFEKLTRALIEAENHDRRTTERFQQFADLGADTFWEFDAGLRLTYAAGDLAGMFGLLPENIVGQPWSALSPRLERLIPGMNSMISDLKHDGVWEGPLSMTGQKRQPRTVRIVGSVLRDSAGRIRCYRGTVVDITLASKLAAELKHQATHDPLTGLHNRREFDRLLNVSLTEHRQGGAPFCVCMLDLDRFKAVNDSCGHAAGDALLKQLADQIRHAIRDEDVLARHGGDEFTLLLQDCTLEQGIRIADTVRLIINAFRFNWGERSYQVGVSIGIAEIHDSMDDGEAVLQAADACCIKAKHQGRDQVQAWAPDDEQVARQHLDMQWMPRITQALEEDRLQLYHQLIVPLKAADRQELHLEVLLRLRDPDGSLHAPSEFLPAAERYDLIGRIDRWVISRVLDWLENQMIGDVQQLVVNINLSGITVCDESFQHWLVDTLQRRRVVMESLCFELTESAAMGNANSAIAFLSRLRSMGCKVALDDFGTGFSSLSQIKHLPVDYIKIDGAFIREVLTSPLDRALVKCVADFARILNVRTVAEFVDSDAVCRELQRLKIDYAQGYLFSEPTPLPDLIEIRKSLPHLRQVV